MILRRPWFLMLMVAAAGVIVLAVLFFTGTWAPPETKPVQTVNIPADEYDPAVWGKAYPAEYDLWLQTKDPRPAGESKYKRGWDTDEVVYDKLSEFPYMALLFNGWGFGVEYNEPRGHSYMVTDQLEVDPSRLKAGGVCLTCKTPFAAALESRLGAAYYSDSWYEVHAEIPAEFATLGVACIDCHESDTMALKIGHPVLERALKDMGVETEELQRQDMRSLVCAQCHVTYVIPKDAQMKSLDVFFPWQEGSPGDISVEDMIEVIRSNPSYLEWKQSVTGFKLGFIRHPEYELFSNGSTHWRAGLACADCHMPYVRVGVNKVSDHNVMSPLKNELKACAQCHNESAASMRERVLGIQDRVASLLNRAGYGTAVTAKLFEMANAAQAAGKAVRPELYDEARELYEQAFYRVVFVGAENSVGFHNPSEAARICGDSAAMAGKAEALLRQGLAEAGVSVPVMVDLELEKYLNDRGEAKLDFKPEQELPDPFGTQGLLTSFTESPNLSR